MFGPFGERLSCARPALGTGGAGAPYRAQIFFCYYFSPKSEENIATVRAGGLEEGQGMGQTSGNAAIYGRLANVSLTGLGVYFFVEGGFESFFRVVPLSSYSNPKNARCGDNKMPCNRA
jgi:hypothetical protein